MNRMQNVMRAQAAMVGQGVLTTRLGIVSAYDPNTYSVKVQFPPDATETGWIPLGALAVGSGWGVYAPPVIGDQIAVTFQDGDRDAGIAGLRLFDNQSPPLPVPSGEFWMVHASGSALKFHADGSVEVSAHTNLTATVGGNLSATVTGSATLSANSWAITGNATWNGNMDFTGQVSANGHRIDDTHLHINTQPGSGVSGKPQ